MGHRFSYISILILSILVASLGTSYAGSSLSPFQCQKCQVVRALPSCCAATDDNAVSGPGATPSRLPAAGGCSHDGLCRNIFQPTDVSTATGTLQNDSVFVQSNLHAGTCPVMPAVAAAPLFLKSPAEKSPPLYLRNCSLLI